MNLNEEIELLELLRDGIKNHLSLLNRRAEILSLWLNKDIKTDRDAFLMEGDAFNCICFINSVRNNLLNLKCVLKGLYP